MCITVVETSYKLNGYFLGGKDIEAYQKEFDNSKNYF